ncbi:MAG: VanZ family protein [Bacteroidota bacterium]|jgi:VanZ family protein|nr:VanZ family protein [Bacteroidota bacterium]
MKTLRTSFYLYLSLSILWFILIVYAMMFYNNTSDSRELPLYFDKFIHFFLFFIQSLLITKSVMIYDINLVYRYKFLILFSLSLFAIITEYQHYFIAYRNFDIFDMLTNIIGVIIGVFLFDLFKS